jgi:RNA recognition motif-containing protein
MVIYVGNLSFDANQRDLSERFEQYGQVTSINIMKDEISGNPLGFAFIEMEEESAARQAIASLDRTRIKDRTVIVCETAPRTERRRPMKKREAHGKKAVAEDAATEQVFF